MHVVVIGAGMAGLGTAKALGRHRPTDLDITVVDPKTYVQVYWASVRALFSSDVAIDSTIPLAPWAKKHDIRLIRAYVAALNTSSLTLDSGETVAYDVCVIATGSVNKALELARGPYDADLQTRRKKFFEDGERFLNAKHVLIVGGGSIGVEYAGDIAGFAAQQQKGTKVTLVHSKSHLVPELSPSGGAKVKDQLEAQGVRVVLDDKAVEKDGKWTLESSGELLDVDEVLVSIGVEAANDYMKNGDLAEALDESGWIQVDDQFRVKGANGRVFALGDCCDAHPKTAIDAFANTDNVAKNVLQTIDSLKKKADLKELANSLKTKSSAPPVFLVLSGPKTGVAKTPLGNITWGLPLLKNKTMFMFRAKQEMGL